MSDLENTAKPWLMPTAIRGNGTTYHRTGRTAIATWAFKTALVMACRMSSMPPGFYRFLFEHRHPPEASSIWIGAFPEGAYRTYNTHVPLRLGPDEPEATGDDANAFMTTLTVGYLVFHVFGNESGRPSPHGFEGQLARSLSQIWPITDAGVVWPPEFFLTSADLDVISNAYGKFF